MSIQGRVRFDANGKEYTLRFTTNALCALEEALGKGIEALAGTEDSPPGMRDLRRVVWAGLIDAHGDLPLNQVGEIIDGAGGVGALMDKLTQAMSNALPDQEGASGNATAGQV